MRPARSVIARECGVIAAFTGLAIVGTYPLIGRFATAVPAGGDTWAYYWNLDWVQRAIFDLHVSPFFSSELYFPYGTSLYFHTLNLLQSAIGSPVAAIWGLPAAYNCLVLLSFILTGYATYRLALYVLNNDHAGSAFLAGVIFTFSSYRYVHVLGHLDLVSTQWLPLFVLFILKTARESGWRNPVIAAVFLATAALTTPYYLLFLIVFTGLLVAWTVLRRHDGWQSAVARFATAMVFTAVLLSPVLIPMVHQGPDAGRTPNPAYDIDRFSGDLASFVIPSALAPWSRGIAARLHSAVTRPGTSVEGTLFLGYLPILLAGLGLTQREGRGFWLIVFITFSALALGPVLYVAGSSFPALSPLMPYRLLLYVPFGDVPRVPARFVVMAGMALAVLASIGASRLLRDQRRRVAIAAVPIFCAIIVAEQAVLPLPLSAAVVPAYYGELAGAPDRGGLIEVPIPADPARFPARMLFQTVHRLPVYGGYLARGLPPLPFPAVPGFSQFVSLSPGIDDVVPYSDSTVDAVSRTVLAACRARHLVIDRHLMTPAQVEAARAIADRLFGPDARVHQDAHTLAYIIPANIVPAPNALWLDTGWSYLERDSSLAPDGRSKRWRWMGTRARLGVTSTTPQHIRLRIRAQSFGRPRRLQLLINGTQAGILTIGVDQGDYETQALPIDDGVSFIEFVSLDGTDTPGTDRRLLSVALHRAELRVER